MLIFQGVFTEMTSAECSQFAREFVKCNVIFQSIPAFPDDRFAAAVGSDKFEQTDSTSIYNPWN